MLLLLLLLPRLLLLRLRGTVAVRLLLRLALLLGLALLLRRARAGFIDDGFVGDELVTVLLQNRAGEGAAAHHEDTFVVLLELVDESDEIAVAGNNRKRVDVIVRECHFQGIQREVDIGAVFVATGRRIALHHLHSVLGECARGGFLPSPVGVSELGDDFAAFLECVQNRSHVEFAVQRGLHSDFDVVEIDEHGDFQFLFHVVVLNTGVRRSEPGDALRRIVPGVPLGGPWVHGR